MTMQTESNSEAPSVQSDKKKSFEEYITTHSQRKCSRIAQSLFLRAEDNGFKATLSLDEKYPIQYQASEFSAIADGLQKAFDNYLQSRNLKLSGVKVKLCHGWFSDYVKIEVPEQSIPSGFLSDDQYVFILVFSCIFCFVGSIGWFIATPGSMDRLFAFLLALFGWVGWVVSVCCLSNRTKK